MLFEVQPLRHKENEVPGNACCHYILRNEREKADACVIRMVITWWLLWLCFYPLILKTRWMALKGPAI